MLNGMCLFLFSITPLNDVPVARCEVIELNHYYDKGRLVFDQIIYWGRYQGVEGLHVLEWRLVKDCRRDLTEQERDQMREEFPGMDCHEKLWIGSPMVPRRKGGEWEATWLDPEGVLLRVRACSFRETHTDYDQELEDREIVPKEDRRRIFVRSWQ